MVYKYIRHINIYMYNEFHRSSTSTLFYLYKWKSHLFDFEMCLWISWSTFHFFFENFVTSQPNLPNRWHIISQPHFVGFFKCWIWICFRLKSDINNDFSVHTKLLSFCKNHSDIANLLNFANSSKELDSVWKWCNYFTGVSFFILNAFSCWFYEMFSICVLEKS